ncbi:sensor histidine kinase [Nocardioides lentus]
MSIGVLGPSAGVVGPRCGAPRILADPPKRVAEIVVGRGPREVREDGRVAVDWRTAGRLVVLVAAVPLLCVQATLLVRGHDVAVGPAIALAAALSVAGPLALWRPRAAAALMALASGAQMSVTTAGGVGGWPWAVAPMLTALLVVVVLGVTGGWTVVLAVLVVSLAQTTAFAVLGAPWRDVTTSLANLSLWGSLATMAAALGVLGGRFTDVLDALRFERGVSADAQARRVVIEERARVARELHDVIAHNMSLVTVQARSAPARVPGLSAEAAAEFEQIAERASDTLAQMRGVLTVLRTEPGQSGRAPVPTLAQVPELFDAVRGSGQALAVSWRVDDAAELDEEVGATAYRIVQETLSNVRRHAPGSPVTVEVVTGPAEAPGELTIDVSNPLAHGLVAGPPGHGLVGMAERAAAVGGDVETGELVPGEYVVRARLPLRARTRSGEQP